MYLFLAALIKGLPIFVELISQHYLIVHFLIDYRNLSVFVPGMHSRLIVGFNLNYF
jgi:hypothetical protein